MKNLYIEKLKVDLFTNSSNVNKYAKEKDNNRNHVNYGSATTIAKILMDFGCKVELPVWEDNGYLKIPFIRVDDWKIEYADGK